MVTVAITNQKGGAGKTTTAQALASTLGSRDKHVLLVDADPQASVTYASGVDDVPNGLYDVMAGDCKTKDAVIPCGRYELLAADARLSEIAATADADPMMLSDALKRARYDYCVIDTPPAAHSLTINALSAADWVVIPIEPSPFALQGLTDAVETIDTIRDAINGKLKIAGILVVRYSNRAIINRNIVEMLSDYAQETGILLFHSVIRDSIAVKEAQMMRTPLIDYAPSSKPCADYKDFCDELTKIIGG